ncbi:hypothetical protein [Isoptericola sp. NPDC057191]|uniref:hypothetical protein n=1 Tax=Isoptericola sp. NPDC057191 TaxID=3346041 RepID=UPI003645E486
MSDDVVELKVRVRRRSARIAAVALAALVLLVGWWFVSASATVVTGSASSTGAGHTDQCAYPDDDIWAVFAKDETPVVVQTVRNDGRWPVEVISTRPEAYRFGPLAADRRDDATFPDPALGPPADGETSDRVTIPPGREVPMWVIDPLRPTDPLQGSAAQVGFNARDGVESAPVRVRSLGLLHDADIPLYSTLWQSDLTTDSPDFQDELAQLCDA